MLEEGDDVGESFVEGEDVRIGRLAETAVQAVKQSMRRLMGDDIVRESAKYDAMR